ncbi:hypothetical protein [Microlunatus soli]|uniref:hypothetical protein n=1 Tax=Microlunatus soli TaxID=630515 RepID=UPI0012F7FC76|nr:hypothetical protein [Microlunatus soli]
MTSTDSEDAKQVEDDSRDSGLETLLGSTFSSATAADAAAGPADDGARQAIQVDDDHSSDAPLSMVDSLVAPVTGNATDGATEPADGADRGAADHRHDATAATDSADAESELTVADTTAADVPDTAAAADLLGDRPTLLSIPIGTRASSSAGHVTDDGAASQPRTDLDEAADRSDADHSTSIIRDLVPVLGGLDRLAAGSAQPTEDHAEQTDPSTADDGALRSDEAISAVSGETTSTDRGSADSSPTGALLERTTTALLGDSVAPLIDHTVTPLIKNTVAPVLDASVGPLVDQAVTPVVDKAAAPLLDHTVAPIVEGTVAPIVDPLVDKTVSPVLDQTVTPLVDRTVGPLVDETVAPLLDQTVSPVVDEVAHVAAPITRTVVSTAVPVTEAVGDVAAPVINTVTDVAAPVTTTVGDVTAPVINSVTDVTAPVINTVTDVTAPVINTVTAPVVNATSTVTTVVDPIVTAISGPVGSVTEVINIVTQPLTGAILPTVSATLPSWNTGSVADVAPSGSLSVDQLAAVPSTVPAMTVATLQPVRTLTSDEPTTLQPTGTVRLGPVMDSPTRPGQRAAQPTSFLQNATDGLGDDDADSSQGLGGSHLKPGAVDVLAPSVGGGSGHGGSAGANSSIGGGSAASNAGVLADAFKLPKLDQLGTVHPESENLPTGPTFGPGSSPD